MSHPNTTLGGGKGFADKDQLEQMARLVGNVNSQDERMIGIDYSAHGIGIKYRGTPLYITFNPGTETDGTSSSSDSLPDHFTIDYVFRVTVKPPASLVYPVTDSAAARSHTSLLEGTLKFKRLADGDGRIEIFITTLSEYWDTRANPQVAINPKVVWSNPDSGALPVFIPVEAADDVTAAAEVLTVDGRGKAAAIGERMVATVLFSSDGTWSIPQPDVDGIFEIIPWEFYIEYGAGSSMVFMYEELSRRFSVQNFFSPVAQLPTNQINTPILNAMSIELPEAAGGTATSVYLGERDPSTPAIPGSSGMQDGLELGFHQTSFFWSWVIATVIIDSNGKLFRLDGDVTTWVTVPGKTTTFNVLVSGGEKQLTFNGGVLTRVKSV